MSGSRLKLLLIVAGIASGALTLLTWTRTWFTVQLDATPALIVSGQSAAPGLSALGLACLALAGALAIAGRRLRFALGAIESLIGAAVAVTAAGALAEPVGASASTITAATAISGSQSVAAAVLGLDTTGWPWIALLAGILMLATGVAVVILSPRWPGAAKKYDREGAAPAGAGASDWDTLSNGSDPTIR